MPESAISFKSACEKLQTFELRVLNFNDLLVVSFFRDLMLYERFSMSSSKQYVVVKAGDQNLTCIFKRYHSGFNWKM